MDMSHEAFLYYAVYTSSEQDIRIVKMEFIRQFSRDEFDAWLAPYLRREPGFIFAAPTTKYLYWFIDRLARYHAGLLGLEYIPHSQLIAPTIPDELDLGTCGVCGCTVETTKATGGICAMCQADREEVLD